MGDRVVMICGRCYGDQLEIFEYGDTHIRVKCKCGHTWVIGVGPNTLYVGEHYTSSVITTIFTILTHRKETKKKYQGR